MDHSAYREPSRDHPNVVVFWGPFRLSRNPAIATHFAVVLREEEFLARRFGRAYDQYKATVPRWL